MQTEIYKDIPEYEGIYRVSDLGNVMRVSGGQGAKTGRVLIPSALKGYHRASLLKNGVMKKYLVHRLVALSFLLNTESKKEVNHKNGIKTDNRVENLEWCTSRENIIHSIKVLGYTNRGVRKRGVIQIDKFGNEVNRYNCITYASIFTGVSGSSIGSVCKGKLKTAGGYKWNYA